ncbi:MAG: hypothetical protein RSF83_00095 [Hungatella sp.]
MKKYSTSQYVDQAEQKDYVNGLKRYEAKGIPVYIDGEKPGEEDWERIFEIREDGSFYMSDYVGLEDGSLREIHIDLVYNR